jgi:hypothetical protein
MLDKYIADLLYRYDCVIVPDFGGFLTNEIGAQISLDTNRFQPPKKELAFNINLSNNDGLLANYIAKAKGISFEKANELIKSEVSKLKNELNEFSSLEIKGVGSFKNLGDNIIEFSADEKVNYLTSSYGLNTFTSLKLNNTLDKDIQVRELTPQIVRKSNFSILKYAAALLPLATIASLAYFHQVSSYNINLNSAAIDLIPNSKVEKATPVKAELVADEKTADFEKAKADLEKENIENALAKSKEEKRIKKVYHIISGAFGQEQNAERKVSKSLKMGVESEIIGKNSKGLYMVSYKSFDNFKDAREFMFEIRKKDQNPGAWIWKQQL